MLFDYQADVTERALKYARCGLLLDTGMGKTFCFSEFANQVVRHTNKPAIILSPLGVTGQTIEEASKYGIEINKFNGRANGIQITNYEQLQHVNPDDFAAVVIDEASILKSFDGKTRSKIISAFKNTPFKLPATATPSPNDPMEICNYAEFLNVMSRNEALAMYFVHDGGQTSKWRLKGHAVNEFYRFVNSWAVMASRPSDLGYSDENYKLPRLNIHEVEVSTKKRDNGQLFNDTAISATDFNQELRLTTHDRLNKVAEIANSVDENFIVWVKQNQEADYLMKLIPDAVEVRGNMPPEMKEERLLGFGKNQFRVLITKTRIASFGLNYQNCHNQIFAAPDFSFEMTYQGIRRSWRFGQKSDVNIYIIKTDTMQNVYTLFKQKQAAFKQMQELMKQNYLLA